MGVETGSDKATVRDEIDALCTNKRKLRSAGWSASR